MGGGRKLKQGIKNRKSRESNDLVRSENQIAYSKPRENWGKTEEAVKLNKISFVFEILYTLRICYNLAIE